MSPPLYTVRYPDEWTVPPVHELYSSYDMTKITYTPYKRISHFREHLHRLTYSQFVTISNPVWLSTCHFLGCYGPLNDATYYALKKQLKRDQLSYSNEHIHHMISRFYKVYLTIDPGDFFYMCQLFNQIEYAFLNLFADTRKNFISYYIVVQFILYLFHYHPLYILPSIKKKDRRCDYYHILLICFANTPLYEQILYIHFTRKKQCYHCCSNNPLFDNELVSCI